MNIIYKQYHQQFRQHFIIFNLSFEMGKNKKLTIKLNIFYFNDKLSLPEKEYEIKYQKTKVITYQEIQDYLTDYLKINNIYQEVKMSYFGNNGVVNDIGPDFNITHETIYEQYNNGTLCIMLQPYINILTDKMTKLEDRIAQLQHELKQIKQKKYTYEQKQSFIRNQYPAIHKAVSQSIKFTKNSSISSIGKITDIIILFSQPLIKTKQSNRSIVESINVEPIQFREQVYLLKQNLKKTSRGQIFMKCDLATTGNLINLLNSKLKILHLICHTEITIPKNNEQGIGILYFQQISNIGVVDLIPATDIYSCLKYNKEFQPKLIFINSCHSQLLVEAFEKIGIKIVVLIQTHEKIHDKCAQKFTSSFYTHLFNGKSIRDSFNLALDCQEITNSSVCCCFHTKQHNNGCLWIKQIQKKGQLICHKQYHIPMCSCKDRFSNYHQRDCIWAIQTLFQINKDFGIIKNGIRTKPNLEEIQNANLLICCCSTSRSLISHDDKRKFMLKGDLKQADDILFPSQIYDDNKFSEVYDETSSQLLNQFKKHSKVIGRNIEIYRLIQSIKNEHNRIIMFSGSIGEGRTSLVAKTVNYMHQRKEFKSEYFHLDLVNCNRREDLEIMFAKNSKILKGYTFQEIIKYLKQKDSLIICDNADLYCSTSQELFAENIKYLRNQLPKTKFIIIITDQTFKKLNKSKFMIDIRLQLEPLSEEFAAQMFIKNVINYLLNIDYEHIKKLFKDANLRNPKVILNISHFIKNKFSGKKVSIDQIQHQINKVLSANPQSKSDPFLIENLKFLKKKIQVYKFFQFLNQFQDGLNELDFTIISSPKKQGEQHKSVNDNFSFVTQNWKQTLKYLIAENFLIASQSQEDLFKQGDYYYCIVQKNIDGFLKIRIKKYINQQFKRLKKDQQDLELEKELKFYSVAYLSIYSTLLVQIFKEKFFYHQDILEYNNISRCGIFLFVKQVQKRNFFDDGDYYPNQTSQHLTSSINKAKSTDHYLKQIFKNNELQNIHPSQSIFHHRQNFLQIYKTDYSEFYKILPSQKKKLFKYYYQNILLNIPSLIKLTKQKINSNFLRYSINQSIGRMDSLEVGKISKTDAIHILKLQMMKLIQQIQLKKDKVTLKNGNFNEFFKSIEDKLLDKQIQLLDAEIIKTIRLDILMIKIYLLFEILKQNQINLKNIIPYVEDFIVIYNNIDKFPQTKIIYAKFNLLIGQIWYYCKTNNIEKNTTIFSNFQKYFQQEIFDYKVINVFRENRLKLLEVKSRILYIKLNLIKKNTGQLEVNQLFLLRKDYLLNCKINLSNMKYKLKSNQISSELSALQDQINNRIWEATNNFLIFMKAAPFINKNQETIYLNTIRKNHNFKKLVQSYLNLEQDKRVLKQKEVSVRFQVLTLNRLNQIIPQGCSILVLTTDITVKQNKSYIQFEEQESPIQSLMQVSSFCDQINSLENLNILILCGENTRRLSNALQQKQNCPIIISIEYIKPEKNSNDFFSNYYNLYSIESLQKIASNYFLSNFCHQVVYTYGKIKYQTISTIFSTLKQQTKLFMMKFSKVTHKADKFEQIIKIDLENKSHKEIQLNFTVGQYHNISSQRSSLHNIKHSTSNFAGRAKDYFKIIDKFNSSKSQNKPCYINLYGAKGSGKTSFILELSQILIERGYFKSGIYIMKGWEIYNQFKGQISQYLQKHKNEIFSITYLNEKKVDNSKMLIIIDDFQALKDRTHYLQYFFNSIYEQKVNFILISNQKLNNHLIPFFDNKKLEQIELEKLQDQESALLAFTFIPLYDYQQFRQNYYRKFKELKQSLGGKWLPSMVLSEFEKLFKPISIKHLPQFENYKSYIKNNNLILKQSSQIKSERSLESFKPPIRMKKNSNVQYSPSIFQFKKSPSTTKGINKKDYKKQKYYAMNEKKNEGKMYEQKMNEDSLAESEDLD